LCVIVGLIELAEWLVPASTADCLLIADVL
jgi:hypothetical protein